MTLLEEFKFWISSIFDSAPLPDEVDTLLFIVKQKGKYTHLELEGYEKKPDFNKIAFRPLEAQFFYHNELQNLTDSVLESRIKYLLEETFYRNEIYSGISLWICFGQKLEHYFGI